MELNEDTYEITLGKTTEVDGTTKITFGHWVCLYNPNSGQRFIGAGITQQEALECAQKKFYDKYPESKYLK